MHAGARTAAGRGGAESAHGQGGALAVERGAGQVLAHRESVAGELAGQLPDQEEGIADVLVRSTAELVDGS